LKNYSRRQHTPSFNTDRLLSIPKWNQSRAFTLRQTAKHRFFLDKIQHPACCIPAKGMFRQLTINTRSGVNCVHCNCSGFFPIPG
jgi:hypothetical protein